MAAMKSVPGAALPISRVKLNRLSGNCSSLSALGLLLQHIRESAVSCSSPKTTSKNLTFARFMNILLHGAGSTAVLGATESSGLKNSRSKLADADLVIKFATGIDRAAFHVFARQLAGKARMLSFRKEK